MFQLVVGSFVVVPVALAQSFDAEAFEQEINDALESMPGVSVEIGEDSDFETYVESIRRNLENVYGDEWLSNVGQNPPEFGFVVNDADGIPVELIGGDVPYELSGGQVSIAGYQLPQGYSIITVGPAGWADAASTIVDDVIEATIVDAPSRGIARAIDTISGAGDYIAQELCPANSRPTELVLNLTAAFELVFNLETGSQVTWDLEVVCDRYQ